MSAHDELDSDGDLKVRCRLCSKFYHRLDVHLHSAHGVRVSEYRSRYPESPVLSAKAHRIIEEKKAETEPLQLPEPAFSATEEEKPELKATIRRRKSKATREAIMEPYNIGCATLFHRNDLSDYDKAFVPKNDEQWWPGKKEAENFEAIAMGIEEGDNVLIVGPTGSGKSTSVLQLASAINQPVRRLNLHIDVRAAEFLGEKTVEVDPGTNQAVVSWEDGVLPQAMRRGHWLLLDELDAAPASILFVLQAVLETGHKLCLMGNGGEVVESHADFRIIATANTLGKGDETGLYTGTNVLNEAFLDRFGVVLQADYPAKDDEIRILVQKAGVDREFARKAVEVAEKVRQGYKTEAVYCTFSTRRLIAWAQKTEKLGDFRKALRLTVLNKLSPDDAETVKDIVQRVFGRGDI